MGQNPNSLEVRTEEVKSFTYQSIYRYGKNSRTDILIPEEREIEEVFRWADQMLRFYEC